jgi:hypothetical protein
MIRLLIARNGDVFLFNCFPAQLFPATVDFSNVIILLSFLDHPPIIGLGVGCFGPVTAPNNRRRF